MSGSKTQEIVILGGNFGGVGVAHYLLRHTIPALQKLDSEITYHVTLVTPNTHFLFKPATPRVLIAPNLMSEDKIWMPLTDAFKNYPTDQITVVQGIAANLDPSTKTVTVKLNASGEQTVTYDSLVIATGTKSDSAAYNLHDDQSLTTKTFKTVQEALPKAKTALIAGGGAVGVETAGEIGVAFPSIELTVLSGSSRLLERVNPKLGAKAQTYLEKTIGAKVVHNVKVTASSTNGDGTTAVTLSDGTTQTVDLFIDCTGGKPNSSFLPKSWLDESGRVLTKDAHFRVKGDGDAKDIYVVGDVVSGSDNSIFHTDGHIPTVASAIGVDTAAKIGKEGKAPPQKEFAVAIKDTMLVPIGPNGGVGQIMGWSLPSFFVKFAKSKTFLIDMFPGYVNGDKWSKP